MALRYDRNNFQHSLRSPHTHADGLEWVHGAWGHLVSKNVLVDDKKHTATHWYETYDGDFAITELDAYVYASADGVAPNWIYSPSGQFERVVGLISRRRSRHRCSPCLQDSGPRRRAAEDRPEEDPRRRSGLQPHRVRHPPVLRQVGAAQGMHRLEGPLGTLVA